jgi:hypothetical protein
MHIVWNKIALPTKEKRTSKLICDSIKDPSLKYCCSIDDGFTTNQKFWNELYNKNCYNFDRLLILTFKRSCFVLYCTRFAEPQTFWSNHVGEGFFKFISLFYKPNLSTQTASLHSFPSPLLKRNPMNQLAKNRLQHGDVMKRRVRILTSTKCCVVRSMWFIQSAVCCCIVPTACLTIVAFSGTFLRYKKYALVSDKPQERQTNRGAVYVQLRVHINRQLLHYA